MTKEALEKVASDILARYPKIDKVFVTGDGQGFFNESDAGNHARRNRTGKELTVNKYLRVEKPNKADIPTVKILEAVIVSLKTIEEVEEIIMEEAEYGNRKGVLEAAKKRITELTKTEE